MKKSLPIKKLGGSFLKLKNDEVIDPFLGVIKKSQIPLTKTSLYDKVPLTKTSLYDKVPLTKTSLYGKVPIKFQKLKNDEVIDPFLVL